MRKIDNGYCRSCGRPIKWIRMESGRLMPVDPEYVWYVKDDRGREKLVTEDGEIVSCRSVTDPFVSEGRGYISHFATCPDAAEHRKRG